MILLVASLPGGFFSSSSRNLGSVCPAGNFNSKTTTGTTTATRVHTQEAKPKARIAQHLTASKSHNPHPPILAGRVRPNVLGWSPEPRQRQWSVCLATTTEQQMEQKMEQKLESERAQPFAIAAAVTVAATETGQSFNSKAVTKNPYDPWIVDVQQRPSSVAPQNELGESRPVLDLLSFFQLRLELWQVATTPTHFPRMSSLEFAFSGQESDLDQRRHTVRQSLKLNQDHALNVWTVPNT
ncbi:hypothetical protein ACLKA6_005894 [Drosophila palustris]